jgi:hypothetical protein
VIVRFIDDYREVYGVEPICRVLPITPSTYFRRKAEQRDPSHRSLRDEVLRAIIRCIWEENHRVDGPRKVWKQMGREGLHEARCRVRRLMREMVDRFNHRRLFEPIGYAPPTGYEARFKEGCSERSLSPIYQGARHGRAYALASAAR